MKNTVRKFLSLALAMIMVLGLAACGGDKSTSGTTSGNTSGTTSSTTTNQNGTTINPGVKLTGSEKLPVVVPKYSNI